MKDYKRAAKTIWFHTKILMKGLMRTMCGAATAGLIALAAISFYTIPTEDGYVAVCDFIVAIATIVMALSCMYIQGANYKKGAKR